jgi:phosphatidylserine/phosphatidylglycerophosphate/cardiolipin synthase-like enzyme
MTKRRTTTKKKKTTSKNRILSCLGTILGAIGVVIAAIFGLLTGGNPPANTNTPAPTQVAAAPGNVTTLSVPGGFGASKGFWQVYFTAPTGSSDRATYTRGIDTALAAAIGAAQTTIDVAAFEFNNQILTQALLDARRRGVRVRMVTDDEHGLEDEDSTIQQFISARISVVDDARSALMHNKFMIIDSNAVWTGSWNYTVNDTYRNNNNALVLRSRQAVANYQTEFEEMFTQGRFGPTSPANTPNQSFTQDGTGIQIYFAPEDEVVDALVTTVSGARQSIQFMTFSFTLDPLGEALIAASGRRVQVQGIFERTGSETDFSEMTPLHCAGIPVRQDGNNYILHHKVFIVDNETVITGSFNVSANATDSNDENLLIIRDRDLAAQYLAEFQRRWAEAAVQDDITCS